MSTAPMPEDRAALSAAANSDAAAAAPIYLLPLLLVAFAALWWLLPRLLARLARCVAASSVFAGGPSHSEVALLAELRANRQELRATPNMERNFVAIARLDRRANQLRTELRPGAETRAARTAFAGAVAGLAARAIANATAVVFLWKASGWTAMRSGLLADWFAPFHWLLTLGGGGDRLTTASLILLCLGAVSLASGLARCGAGFDAFVADGRTEVEDGGRGDGFGDEDDEDLME